MIVHVLITVTPSKTYHVKPQGFNYVPYSKKHWQYENFGELQEFSKFFANFHDFHNISYANGFNSPKFVLLNFLQFLFTKLFYHQSFLLYNTCMQKL